MVFGRVTYSHGDLGISHWGSFYALIVIINNNDYNKNGFGGHCMCIIGYDDFKFKEDGGFLIFLKDVECYTKTDFSSDSSFEFLNVAN